MAASYLGVLSVLVTSLSEIEAAYTSTPGPVSGCAGGSATLTWVYDNPGDVSSIAWDFGLINVFNYQPSTGTTVPGAPQFAGRVTHNGDGSIIIGSLSNNDAGSYTCTTGYNSNPTAVDSATLTVNTAFADSISTVLTVSGRTATVNLGSQNGVDVEWKNTAGTVVGTGTTFTGDGTFTVCLTGCVSGSATACQQLELKESTTVHGSSTTYFDTTESAEENSTADIFKTSFEAETSTEISTQRNLNVDDDLLAIVVSSLIGGIIFIIIIVFILYFIVKRVRRDSKKKISNTHTNEGTYDIGMVTESYSSNHNEGESRKGSKPQRMDDY